MDTRLHLNIVSPEREVFDGDVKFVRLPGSLCPFVILPEHAPIVSSLDAGKITYEAQDSDQECSIDIKGGFAEKTGDIVTVCIS
jgi:F-type H+-transporting ATPase subunit epsilon